MKALIKQVPNSMMVTILFLLLFLFANAASAQSNVVITGTVLTAPGTDQAPQGELIASNGEHMAVIVRPNGRFRVIAPTGDSYVLRFTQNGGVTKEVVVDTREADTYKLRKVHFDVVLHGIEGRDAMRYATPVGRIAFHRGEARPQIEHRYELIHVSTLIAQEGR